MKVYQKNAKTENRYAFDHYNRIKRMFYGSSRRYKILPNIHQTSYEARRIQNSGVLQRAPLIFFDMCPVRRMCVLVVILDYAGLATVVPVNKFPTLSNFIKIILINLF
ncbi:hypothetical protein BDC45DRAFT_537823 [Circinella umbellata]|nr:hypothetical protein BDC45DRAFT_537823 [Circinella umbellata]